MKKKNEWVPLAGGGNNEVYVNFKTRMVFKTVHNFEFDTDTPERSVRLWNLLNPTVRPKAKITTVKIDGVKITGWTCPYIQNQYSKDLPPSIDARAMIEQDRRAYKNALQNPQIREQEDLAIMHTLIDIYNRSGVSSLMPRWSEILLPLSLVKQFALISGWHSYWRKRKPTV